MAKITAYQTKLNTDIKLQKVFEGELCKCDREEEAFLVNVYDEVTYQEVIGFGAAFTEASAYCYSLLTDENKEKFIKLYFDDEDGIGYNLGRIHMNSSDFSLGNYSCCENESETLEGFNIERDKQYILPLIKDANKTKVCKMLVSPWSPPAWMKTNKEMNHGGKLLAQYRDAWALHYAKFIKAMRAEGVDIQYVSVQNEPNATQIWDSCCFNGEEERDFVKNHLGPTLEKEGLSDVKLLIWDHNKERVYDRSKVVYDDKEASKYVWGTAFHWYSGDHFETLEMVRKQYPDKKLIFTEGCVEAKVDYGFELNAERYAHDIIGNFKHGMNGFIEWNLLLDELGGPNHVKNYCDAPMRCDSKTGELFVRPAYYYIGQFAKFIKEDAVRIGSSCYTDKLETVAFKNKDGSLVLNVLNRQDDELPFTLRYDGNLNEFTAPAHSLTTLIF